MPHPLVDQYRFTRSEWLRGLADIPEEDATKHFGPMNCISWTWATLAGTNTATGSSWPRVKCFSQN
jgi:hypothetical protein